MAHLLEVEDISKKFKTKIALDNVSLSIKENEIFGLLGPNGAGKTSLIRIINKLLMADKGVIRFKGMPITQNDVYKIGYLPEERGLYKKMKVEEQLVYLAKLKNLKHTEARENVNFWLKKLDIHTQKNKKIEELSKGMQQKIQFISAIIHRPELLILDEPFSGFDPINANLIKSEIQELRQNGSTIVLSSHNMNSVEELCTSIGLINESKCSLFGEIKEIKERYFKQIIQIQYIGSPIVFANALWTDFELIEQISETSEIKTANVRLGKGKDITNLIENINQKVKIVSINKHIPSINDIFLEVVNSSNEQ